MKRKMRKGLYEGSPRRWEDEEKLQKKNRKGGPVGIKGTEEALNSGP